MTDIEALALYAAGYFDTRDGLADGWRELINEWAGQSRTVLHHMDSGYVFKSGTGWLDAPAPHNSGKYIGVVTLTEDPDQENYCVGTFRIRLPEFYYIDVPEWGVVEVSEYIEGETCCDLRGGWCAHAYQMVRASECSDAHNGNYLIKGDEVILFDFEGVRV